MEKNTKIFTILLLTVFGRIMYPKESINSFSPEIIEAGVRITKERYLSYFATRLILTDDYRLWLSPHNSGYINHLTLLSINDEVEQHLNTVTHLAQTHKVKLVAWVTPTNHEIAPLLKKSGFSFIDHYPAMVRSTKDITLPELAGFVIKRLIYNDLPSWLSIVQESFEHDDAFIQLFRNSLMHRGLNDPNAEFYAVYTTHNELVAAGILFIHDNCTGISSLATKKEFRGQGIATALTQFLLQRSAKLNFPYVVLMAAPEATHLYEKIGFTKALDIDLYIYENR